MRVNNSTLSPTAGAEVSSAKKSNQTAKAKYGSSTDSAAGATATNESAKTEISSKARDMSRAKGVAMNAPDSRAEKIAELKKKIADKQYNVSAESISDKMVDDHASSMQALG